MIGWEQSSLKTKIVGEIEKVLLLNRYVKAETILSWCGGDVASHIDAKDDEGWSHVLAGDEYSPFKTGDFAVFTQRDEKMSLQLALNFNNNEMYVACYINERNGWYEWEKYEEKKKKLLIAKEITKTNSKSFYQAMAEARIKTKNLNSLDKQSLNICKKENKPNSESLCTNLKNDIALKIFWDRDEGSRDIKIIIDEITSLEDIRNKIIAVQTDKRFSNGSNLPINLCVECVGASKIMYTVIKKNCSQTDEIKQTHFFTFNGKNFIYMGKLVK